MRYNQATDPLKDVFLIIADPFVYAFGFIEPFFWVIKVLLVLLICVVVYAARINICHFLFAIGFEEGYHPLNFPFWNDPLS